MPAIASAAPTPAARRVSPTPPDAQRDIVARSAAQAGDVSSNATPSSADKPHAQAARPPEAPRARQRDHDSAAPAAHLAAAPKAPRDKREPQRVSATSKPREQQRDALLSLARACGIMEQWACALRSANSVLRIDASNEEAQHLATVATHQAELEVKRPAEPAPERVSEVREPNAHH